MAVRRFAQINPSPGRNGRRGTVAVIVGLMLVVLLGFVSLGSEVVSALMMQRKMQAAADSAALGAATAYATGIPANFRTEGFALASAAGFVNGANNVTVTINQPPTSGNYISNNAAVQVGIEQPQTLQLAGLFRSNVFDIKVRAVAVPGSSGVYCALSTDTSASGAVDLSNNAVLSNPTCGVASNSNSRSSIIVSNNAAIDGPVKTVGGWSLSNNAKLNGTPNTQNASPTLDPYANVQMQTPPACTGQSGTSGNNNTVNLTPGTFCGGWSFGNNVTLNLAPGTYYINQKMNISNNTTVNGNGGVTLVINGNYGINLSNNSVLNLTAPTSGTYSGIAIFGSRTATSTVTQEFSNNTTTDVVGAIYFPNQIVQFDNNATLTASGCTQLIGRIINISNNAELDSNCVNKGTKPIGSSPSVLVE